MRWERMEIDYEIERNEKDMVEDIQIGLEIVRKMGLYRWRNIQEGVKMKDYLGGCCDEG